MYVLSIPEHTGAKLLKDHADMSGPCMSMSTAVRGKISIVVHLAGVSSVSHQLG